MSSGATLKMTINKATLNENCKYGHDINGLLQVNKFFLAKLAIALQVPLFL